MPCAAEAVVRHSGPVSGLTVLRSGTGRRWKERDAGRYLRAGYRLLLGGELTCLRWEDKRYFCAAVKPPDGYGRRRAVSA